MLQPGSVLLAGAKPKKNEQIIVKDQLIYEGPFKEYSINVKVGDKFVKVVFKDKQSKKNKPEKNKPEQDKLEQDKPEQDDPFGESLVVKEDDKSAISSSENVVLDQGFPTYNFEKGAKQVEVEWYMSPEFDHTLFEVFVKFFFGFELSNVKSRFKEYVLDESLPVEPIYRKNLFEQFEYYQNIFKLYSFQSSLTKNNKNHLIPVYQIDVYEIDNKIYDYKDLFNNIELNDEIICIQYETNVKCPIYWSLKTLTIYPNFGQNGFSIVYKRNGVVQTQIIQGNYFYVFSLNSDLDLEKAKPQKIIDIVPLQVVIKKFVKTYFEVQQHLQYEHSQFMMNFSDNFEIQKLSNTNYKIDFLSNITVSIYTRYSTLFFSTISDDISLVKKYFRICQNCGNFEQVQAISDLPTLQVVSPLEFGNTQISNFEHQLESMRKRPSIILDETIKDVLADEDIFVDEDEKDAYEKGENVSNELKRQIVKIQNEMSQNGYLIDGFKFYCNKTYPYLNFTKFDIEFQEDGKHYPLYYYKCQQIPVKASCQNIYKLYDIYRHFKLNEKFEKFLYNNILGLIQQKPNLFLKYETIIPGQYTILPQGLYKLFPNTTFLLKLVMKVDEKVSLNEYRERKELPWDNEWLASVTGGMEIRYDNAVFYNIESNQYFVYEYQPQYDFIMIIYQQQFFTLIEYQQGGTISLGRARISPQNQYSQQSQSSEQSDEVELSEHKLQADNKYRLYKIDFKFDKEINKYFEGYGFNDEYIETKYLKHEVIVSKQGNICAIIPDKKKISEPYIQKSTYDQVSLINQNKDVIGYKQYGVYVYYKNPEKIKYDQKYVLSNQPVKIDPSITMNSNIRLSIGEIASIIVFNNKTILLEELSKISNIKEADKLYKKLQLNIGKEQDIKLYNTKINYLTSVITEKQAKEAIEYIIKTKPNSENLLKSFIENYIFDDQLYYDPRNETIKQVSAYIQLQNVLRYRNVIQQ